MELERALTIRDLGANYIYQLYHSARISGMTSSLITNERLNWRNELKVVPPRWVISFWEGMEKVLRDQLFQEHLEFCYIVDDKRYSTRKLSPMYYETHNISPKELYERSTYSGFFWKSNGKPYFVSEKKEDEKMEPHVRVLMNMKLEYLQRKAKENNLSTIGTKQELAERIAEMEQRNAKRFWKKISEGGE